ncbi:MAG: hypothetical protein ACQ9ET_05010, partial [Nitrosomonadaceae bacterium]
MASNLNGIELTAPSSDPNIGISESFTMTINGTYSGAGAASTHSLWLEWDQGTDTWEPIPASGGDAGLYTNDVSSYVDTTTVYDAANPISITVYGDAVGSFVVRGRGLRGTTEYLLPGPSQAVTVSSGVDTVTVTTDLDALLQKTLTSTFSLDSLLQRNVPITLSLEGILAALKTAEANIDAKLWGSYTLGLSIDGLLQRIGIQTTLSIDAILSELDSSFITTSISA